MVNGESFFLLDIRYLPIMKRSHNNGSQRLEKKCLLLGGDGKIICREPMAKKLLHHFLMISEMPLQTSASEFANVKPVRRTTRSFLKNWIFSTRILFLSQENALIAEDREGLIKEIKE